MNTDAVIYSLVGVSWLSALFGGTKYVVGSSIYDVRQARLQAKAKKTPNRRELRKRPKITIFIVLSDETTNLSQCIKSIRGSGYRNLRRSKQKVAGHKTLEFDSNVNR